MKDNYVLRSEAETQIKGALAERDAHKQSISILAEELQEANESARVAHERATAADTALKDANARADAHAQTARQVTQALADERASRAKEVDGKLRDHLAPIHMALTKIADVKHGTDGGALTELTAAVNALSARVNGAQTVPHGGYDVAVQRTGDGSLRGLTLTPKKAH